MYNPSGDGLDSGGGDDGLSVVAGEGLGGGEVWAGGRFCLSACRRLMARGRMLVSCFSLCGELELEDFCSSLLSASFFCW